MDAVFPRLARVLTVDEVIALPARDFGPAQGTRSVARHADLLLEAHLGQLVERLVRTRLVRVDVGDIRVGDDQGSWVNAITAGSQRPSSGRTGR